MTNTEEEKMKCHLCGHEFPASTMRDVCLADGEIIHVCHECFSMSIGTCKKCGKKYKIDELREMEDFDFVCDECIKTYDFVKCERCGRYAQRDSGEIYNEEWWGERCVRLYLITCEECGDMLLRSESCLTSDGDFVCRECFNLHYVTCENCGGIIRSESSVCVDDAYYCESCAPRNRGVLDYHEFDSNNYNNKKKIDGENDNLYLGIELECDDGSFDMSDFEDYEEIHFERDGSLSDNGVEMISLPMTLRYHQRFEWNEILSSLIDQGFKSHNACDCGLHVHMSRFAIPATTIAKMDIFINRAKAFWSVIARRDRVYNGYYDVTKELDFTRCFYGASQRCPSKMKGKIDWGKGYDRYTPVNVCNSETVEIRIFRGTLKYQTFMGSIEICHAVVNWLNTVPVTRIYKTKKLILEFIEYLKHNKDRYPHVMPMLESRFKGSQFEQYIKE